MFDIKNYHSDWLTQIETQRANKFYRKYRFKGHVKSHDTCAVVKDQQKDIVACGILRDYQRFNLLTGIALAPNFQGCGIGRMLLNKLATHFDSQTFTFPYSHLIKYYESFGFELVNPTDVIGDIRNLFNRYVNQGRNIRIMKYSGCNEC